MEHENIRDELEYYQGLWDNAQDKMQVEPIHPHPQSEEAPKRIDANELLNERRAAADRELDWRDMLLVSENIDKIFNPERIDEAERSKSAVADVAKRAASAPNPVEKWTLGKDQALRVTPNFNDSEALRELADLKIRFEALEREIHASNVHGEEKQENKLNKQLDSLRSKLEELNDQLTPHMYDL